MKETTETRSIYIGDQFGTLPTPTKSGSTFTGWYTENGTKVNETDIYIYIKKLEILHYMLDGVNIIIIKNKD